MRRRQQTMPLPLPPPNPPAREVPVLGLSIDEAAEAMGMSRSKFKELLADGTVRAARFGRKVVVSVEEVRRVLAEATAISGGVKPASSS